jgi:hypothetical protein
VGTLRGPWSNIVKFRPLLQPIRLQKTLGFRPLLIYKKIINKKVILSAFLRTVVFVLTSAIYVVIS